MTRKLQFCGHSACLNVGLLALCAALMEKKMGETNQKFTPSWLLLLVNIGLCL